MGVIPRRRAMQVAQFAFCITVTLGETLRLYSVKGKRILVIPRVLQGQLEKEKEVRGMLKPSIDKRQ